MTRASTERGAVLGDLRDRLASPGRVLLWGADGIGKTTLLRSLVDDPETFTMVAYLSDRYPTQPYAALVDLLATVPAGTFDRLDAPRGHTLTALLRRSDTVDEYDRVAIRLAVIDLLTTLSDNRRLLLAVDDAQWLDADSADVLGFACHNLRPDRVAVLLTTDDPNAVPGASGLGCQELRVPDWSVTEIAELLARQGLPSRLAGRIHRAAGGNPALAWRIGSVIVPERAGTPLPDTPGIGDPARELARRRLGGLPERCRRSLLLAALTERPTLTLLRRCGCEQAGDDLSAASDADLVDLSPDGEIRFRAGAVADTLRTDAGELAVRTAHLALAGAVDDPVAAVHHRALSTQDDSVSLIGELDEATLAASRRGDRRRAAGLAFIAAERTPADESEAAIRRFRSAARHAAVAGDTGLTQRAARIVLARATDPADRVGVLLSVIEAAGQDFDGLDEVFAEAQRHAAGRPELLAELRLWESWRAHLRDGDNQAAARAAQDAVDLADGKGSRNFTIEALTTVARFRFLCGLPGSEEILARAEALPVGDDPVSPHASPVFVRARIALFGDRLGEARADLLRLLPVAQRLGELKAQVEVLRSLAEVELRAGRCALARTYIRQAVEHVAACDASPGSPLYVAALVEATCGSLDKAVVLARQGLRASREDHDILFTSSNLLALGRTQLVAGNIEEAVDALRKVQTLQTAYGVADPAVVKWQPDFVEALARFGELANAAELLTRAREAATAFKRDNMLAELDRSAAILALATGDAHDARTLLDSARTHFATERLPLEEGRTLLALAGLGRRQRNRAAARALLIDAEEIFERCEATVWLELTRRERARLDPAANDSRGDTRLTPAEARIAELVAAGATNNEVAGQLYVSVKTVEATLTRVYRKLGVRSRGQLAATDRPKI